MTESVMLASGLLVVVDDVDAPLLRVGGWCATEAYPHVHRTVKRGNKWTSEYLHRVIARAGDGTEVDHINDNPLDNRRSNLRIVTRGENERAKNAAKGDSKTGVRGVTWHPERKRFRAYVYSEGKRVGLGYFRSLNEAGSVAAVQRARMLAHLVPVGGG